MEIKALLRESMKVKPASNRGARQKTSTPKDVIRMNYNENPYGMSEAVKRAVTNAAVTSSMYQDFFAVDIKDKIAEMYGLTHDNILIGSGSSSAIDMIGEIFLNYGDEVVYSMPSYDAFPDMASDNGAVRVEIPLDKDFNYDLDAMLAAVNEKTKILVVVNPNNPTGTYIDSAKLEAFIRKIPEHVLVVVDEAYVDYITAPGYYSMIKMIQEGYDRPLIVLRTFSKIYGMAGLRIGYAVADGIVIDELMKASSAWNVSRAAILAAEAALDDTAYPALMREKNAVNRKIVEDGLRELGCRVIDSQTNFVYFKSKVDSKTVQKELAERKLLIGKFDDFNRVSMGTEEQNELFLTYMKEIIDSAS